MQVDCSFAVVPVTFASRLCQSVQCTCCIRNRPGGAGRGDGYAWRAPPCSLNHGQKPSLCNFDIYMLMHMLPCALHTRCTGARIPPPLVGRHFYGPSTPRSPRRADLVAALGETTGAAALSNMLARMQSSPSGRQILAERPRITVRRRVPACGLSAGNLGCRARLHGL